MIIITTGKSGWIGVQFGLGPGFSGRVRAVIFKFFRADIQLVNAKYFLNLFLNIFCCIFYLNLYSKNLFGLFFCFAIMA